MTILPKKKQGKEKTENEAGETTAHQHSHSHTTHGHFGHTHGITDRASRRGSSPTRWSGSGPREEMLASHDPGGGFDEYHHETGANHNKRRHRSSPHRSGRKHRLGHAERPHHSSSGVGTGGASPAPAATSRTGEHEESTGNNSEDEYMAPAHPENIDELERMFEAKLKEEKGFLIKRMREDGACLFRSVADQVFGDQEMHAIVRQSCCDYMSKNADFFKQYVTEDFNTYLNRKRIETCHGNHVEMQAMCELYNRPIEVYQYSLEPMNTFLSTFKTDNEPIRLCYHNNSHYNSVVDPYKATIGVGLGLPGYQPGAADKNLLLDAMKASEDVHIEQTMLEDKLRETDWELTQETLEEQVARESYLQWLRENEQRHQRRGLEPPQASATCSSASASESRASRSPRNRSSNSSPQNSPGRPQNYDTVMEPQPSCHSQNTAVSSSHIPEAKPSASPPPEGAVGGAPARSEPAAALTSLPPAMYGISEWDEDDILAQVMAQSQQEYLDSLKKNKSVPSTSKDA